MNQNSRPIFFTYPEGRHCPEPLRYAIQRLVGLVPPKDLAPWLGLTAFTEIDDEGESYEETCRWVNENAEYVSWFTGSGVLDAAELLVERALETGTLRRNDESVSVIIWFSQEYEGWLCAELEGDKSYGFLVPPNSIKDFLGDLEEEVPLEKLSDDEEQTAYTTMSRVIWEEWTTALYEAGGWDN